MNRCSIKVLPSHDSDLIYLGLSASIQAAVPVGTVMPFPASITGALYRDCGGQRLSVTGFPELYAVIGHTYGPQPTTERRVRAPWWRRWFLREPDEVYHDRNPAYDPLFFHLPDFNATGVWYHDELVTERTQ